MHRIAPALAMALLLAVGGGCGRTAARAPRSPGEAPVVRVMTYNVNFGSPGDGPTLEAIAAGVADVVLLQELNHPWEVALRAQFAGRYPFVEVYPRAGAGGIGVMSRLPIRASQLLKPPGDG